MSYPNLRGTAGRHIQKDVRVATHIKCLELLEVTIKPKYAVEHGMGRSSTPWFHGKEIEVLLSFEDDKKWQTCMQCKNSHVITDYRHSNHFIEQIQEKIPDVSSCICLIDGPGNQRVDAVMSAMQLGIPGIVYHDAETLVSDEIDAIRKMAKDLGYETKQYVAENPETIICFKVPLDLGSSFVEL